MTTAVRTSDPTQLFACQMYPEAPSPPTSACDGLSRATISELMLTTEVRSTGVLLFELRFALIALHLKGSCSCHIAPLS
jgi:hypothetical protein